MRHDTFLPPEFSSLSSKVHFVQKVNSNEWSGSCPNCGGTQHQNGEYPDRFRMWRVSKYGKPMGWCRSCGYIWFPDRDKPPSPEEFEQWRREQLEIERRRKQEAEKAIALLKSEKIWETYHEKLTQYELAISTMKSWGIAKDYAGYWKLGFVEDYLVYTKDSEYHSPAISIPIWQKDGSISNIKLRVLNPKTDHDRYRNWYKLGNSKSFVAFRNFKSDECLLVEGEKKAMVAAQALRNKKIDMQVVGVPTKTPDEEAIRVTDDFKKVYVCLDPDARIAEKGISALRRVVEMIGRSRVSVVSLPGKVDDMINQNGLDIADALRYSKNLGGK